MTVLDFERPMKRTQVKVYYVPWQGQSRASPDQATALVILHYEVNGHEVPREVASLHSGFMFVLQLVVPEDRPEIDDATNKKNRDYYRESIDAVRDDLTASDWLEETTDECLILPISHLELLERPLQKWEVI